MLITHSQSHHLQNPQIQIVIAIVITQYKMQAPFPWL